MNYGMTITRYEHDNIPVSASGGPTFIVAGLGGVVTMETTPSNLERLVNDSDMITKKMQTEWDEAVLRDKFPAVQDAYEKYQTILALTRDAK